MNTTTPVEKIVSLLTGAGYRPLATPLVLAGVKFEIPAALVGTGILPDLIIVADTALESEDRIRSKLEGISRALDVVRSKRPLTAVLAGPRPRTPVLDAISKVCRVLPVGSVASGNEDATLRNWLAVLMPLNLPQTSDAIADPMSELLHQVDHTDQTISALISAARRGEETVAETFHGLVTEVLDETELGHE